MWSELPEELLVRVFMCLNMMDLVLGASHTCRSWRNACKDPILWQKIDLNLQRTNLTERPHTWSDEASAVRVMGLLKCALKFSYGVASCLIFHFNVHVGPDDLIYAAVRTPNLKRVFLPALYHGTLCEFTEAAKHWKRLESITIQRVEDYGILLKALGDNCKRLTHMKLVYTFQLGLARGISLHLPQLKALSLRYTLVYKEAALHLLRTLTGLEALNLSHVLMVDFVERDGAESRVTLRPELGPEVTALGSRLRGFLTCRGGPCERCSGPRDTIHEVARWCKAEEDSWLFDEAPDFCI